MQRREFIGFAGVAVASWPLVVWAEQAAKIPRIGLLSQGRSEGSDASRATLDALVTGLRELGYTEGQNIAIEREFGEANADRLRELAAELVKRRVNLIVALGTPAAQLAKQATSVIPIVGIAMADPVQDELVASLARPGGNVTGTTFLGPELVTKRLQLLAQVVPQHSRVAVLWDPHAYGDRTMAGMVKEAEHAAQTLAMQLQFVPVTSPGEIMDALLTSGKGTTRKSRRVQAKSSRRRTP
jgi:putative tryptophan/tyrosine transport system substrate-binding protein